MSETKKRNVHLPEFKAKVGLEALRGSRQSTRLRKIMEFTRCKSASGKRKSRSRPSHCLRASGVPNRWPLNSAPDRFYGEIGRLKMELDWLKKKSGISLP